MEGVLVGCAGLSSGLAAYLLLGGGTRGSLARRAGRWWFAALRWLERLGRTRPLAALRAREPFGRVARELAARAAAQGVEASAGCCLAALACGTVLLSVLTGILLASPVAAVACASVLVAATVARDAARAQRERRDVIAAMPGIYRTLSVALASGQTLAQAVSYVGAHERGPAARAFARMSLRLRCGSSTEEAVDRLAEELAAPGSELLATALVISHRTGSPLRDLLRRSAALAQRQGEFERMLGVKTAQARLSVRVVCLLPVVMICLLALISPDFQQGLLTPVGMGCVALAVLLDGVALLLIRRLVRGVLRWT